MHHSYLQPTRDPHLHSVFLSPTLPLSFIKLFPLWERDPGLRAHGKPTHQIIECLNWESRHGSAKVMNVNCQHT